MKRINSEKEKACTALALKAEVFCAYLGRAVVGTVDSTHAQVSPCEVCGEHGTISVEVLCECGRSHTLEVNSW
jgi:hypothetical protein